MTTQVGGLYYDVTLDTRQLVAGSRQVQSELERAAQSFNVITTAVKVYAAALSLVKMAQVSDDFRLLQARVNVATDSIQAGAAAMDALREISTRTRTALADNVQMFTRLNPSLKQMGGNAQDTLRVVELLGKAITVSGASAAEKASAMLQFGQALGSGKLAGDEFRAMMESAPYLMKQLADGLGVPIGALKSLSTQGKLTSDVIVNALGKAADKINADFAKMPETLASAMTVASDQFKRLNKDIDDLTGKNSVLIGITKGAGDVMLELAKQLEATDANAGKLGKNTGVEDWAKRTRNALSYVVDAFDWLNEKGGKVLGDINDHGVQPLVDRARSAYNAIRSLFPSGGPAEAAAPRRGERMRQEWADQETASRQAADAAMRRGAGRDAGAPSKLTAQVDPDEQRKLAAKRAAAQAYYEGLLADAQTGLAKINAEEQKALSENLRRSKEDKNNADIYAKAKTAVIAKYARERALLEESYSRETAALTIATTTDEMTRVLAIREEAFRAADADVKLGVKTFQQGEQAKRLAAFQTGQALQDLAERDSKARFEGQFAAARDTETRITMVRDEAIRNAQLAYARGRMTFEEAEAAKVKAVRQAEDEMRSLRDARSQTRIDTLQLRAGGGGSRDQEALIRAQAAQALQATMDAQAADIANAQIYADKRVAIEEDMQRRIADMRAQADQNALMATSNAFGALADATHAGVGKQDAIYKAAFLAQKAFAIASAIVAIQTGVAKAASLEWPANLGAMASVIAATASIVATIKSTNFGGGRQYGGPVSAGSMYRVNETGRPEMFTAASGAQYMLPTSSGKVTSADDVAGQGAGRNVTVINNFSLSTGSGGGVDMRTQSQITASVARALQQSSARNN